ncbi:MAG TPA: hypothetical protein VH681_14050 [Nitrospiraceae bacterium]|jgi:hypothetical protein
MSDVPDVYTDQFQVNLGTFGCTINFQLSGAIPAAPGAIPQIERVATVRMSLEHLKALVFIMHRQLAAYESQAHVSIGLPVEVLRAMQIRQEDWEAFWLHS